MAGAAAASGGMQEVSNFEDAYYVGAQLGADAGVTAGWDAGV